jgi:type IV secretion system protein VirB5
MTVRPSFAAIAMTTCVAFSALGSTPARAQGIPVIDTANLIQTVQQVMNDITEISNQVQQITQLQQQLQSLNGMRNLGKVFNNPALRNYVPAEAYTVVNAIQSSGYAGLNATAKALRDASMVYNCLDLNGGARTDCQATLAQPYQHKGLLQDAMRSASGRLAQINALMDQINATTDQKSVQEIQARIGAENALLSHEMSQLQMLQGMADSEERIARSRERERQYQMLGRTGKVSDYLP